MSRDTKNIKRVTVKVRKGGSVVVDPKKDKSKVKDNADK